MAEFQISGSAEQELLDIYLFGVANFGRPKAVSYQFELEGCFAVIARHPRIGRNADAVPNWAQAA